MEYIEQQHAPCAYKTSHKQVYLFLDCILFRTLQKIRKYLLAVTIENIKVQSNVRQCSQM